MLYLTAGELKIVILESGNLEELKKGRPATTPDGSVLIAWTAGELKIVILESGNLEELKKGRPATTPDGSVLIAWTPDPVWLMERIVASDGDAALIAKAIDEASKRLEKPRPRAAHQTYTKHFFDEAK